MLTNSKFCQEFEFSEVYEGVTKYNFVFPNFRTLTVGVKFELYEVIEVEKNSKKRISELRELLKLRSEFQNDVFNELDELFPEFKEKHQKLQVCLKVRQIRYKFVKFGLNLQSLKNFFKFVLNSINLKLSNKCIFFLFLLLYMSIFKLHFGEIYFQRCYKYKI